MTDNSKKTHTERFSIVPQMLTASKKFSNGEYRVLVVCIGVENIKRENGEPFTHSVMSLCTASAVDMRTVQRIVKRFVSNGILKPYGKMLNQTQYYPIYVFQPSVVTEMLKADTEIAIVRLKIDEIPAKTSDDKLSSVIPIGNIDECVEMASTKTTSDDRSDDKMQARSNIIEGKKEDMSTEVLILEEIINQNSAKAIEARPAVPVGSMSMPSASVSASSSVTPNVNLADAFEALFKSDGSIK